MKGTGSKIEGGQAPGLAKAIFSGRCPVCRKGDVFTNKAWDLGGFLKTHKNCPHCETKYEPEPGFFWGAMYINYGFNVATIAIIGLLVWQLFHPESIFAYTLPIIAGIILTIPITTRFSRMIMLHVFGPFLFDPKKFKSGK
jgi:uncharacterized protein (DUF983 family)